MVKKFHFLLESVASEHHVARAAAGSENKENTIVKKFKKLSSVEFTQGFRVINYK